MPKKRSNPKEIIHKLREADVLLSQGRTIAEVCIHLAITYQTYYRWRKTYGGIKVDQTKRLKDLEAQNACVARLGTVVGPASLGANNIGAIPANDGDLRTGFQSKWRSTRQIFPPRMLYYRVTAIVNGQQVVYTDDPAAFNPAGRDTLPIRIYFQGGRVNPATNALEGNPGPWRNYVAESAPIGQTISEDRATGFRFMIMFNRDVETDVVIDDVTVVIEA